MNGALRGVGCSLVAALSLLAIASPLSAQAAEEDRRGSQGTAVERAAGLDPDLLAVVEQIVGLRMSEQGLLADLTEEQRVRVLEAVSRLLAPPTVTEVASEVSAGATDAPWMTTDTADASEAAIGDSEVGPDGFEAPTRGTDAGPAEVAPVTSPAAGDVSSAADIDPTPAVRAEDDSVACPAWLVWDTNEDRTLSGADRYWRHFVIWVDDGDGVAEEDEMQDTFELGLRKLDLDLRSYEGAKESTGVVERRQVAGLERLRIELLRGRSEYGVLAIDLDGMVRGQAPRLRLRSSDGESVRELQDGYVPVQEGLEIEQVFGDQTRWRPLLCDR